MVQNNIQFSHLTRSQVGHGILPNNVGEGPLPSPCVVCHYNGQALQDHVISCTKCSTRFHQSCHVPPVENKFFGQDTPRWRCASCIGYGPHSDPPLTPLSQVIRHKRTAQGSNKRAKIIPEAGFEDISDAVFWEAAERRLLCGRELEDVHLELATLRHQRDEQSDAMLQREEKIQEDRKELTNVAEAARIQMREQEKRALDHEQVIGLRDKTIEDRDKTIEDRNRMIEARDKNIEECDQNLAKAEEQIKDRDLDLAKVQHQLEERDKELAKAQEQVSSRDEELAKARKRFEDLDSVVERLAQNLLDGQKVVGELRGDG